MPMPLSNVFPPIHRRKGPTSLVTRDLLVPAVAQAFRMLNPLVMMRNPVMFVTEVGAAVTTLVTIQAGVTGQGNLGYFAFVTVMLWLTVLFANFAEALAEARGQGPGGDAAQGPQGRAGVPVRSRRPARSRASARPRQLRKGDVYRVEAGPDDSRRRRSDRRRRFGGRIGDHRRVGPGDSRVRRRPQHRHRRHARAVATT